MKSCVALSLFKAQNWIIFNTVDKVYLMISVIILIFETDGESYFFNGH